MWSNLSTKFLFLIIISFQIISSAICAPLAFSFSPMLFPNQLPTQTHRFLNSSTLTREVEKVSAAFSLQNGRDHMEDYFIRSESYGIFAIFDGHGGNFASKYSRGTIQKLIIDYIWWYNANPYRWFTDMLDFKKTLPIFISVVEFDLKSAYDSKLHKAGSTCLIIVAEKTKLTVANIGDSRAVLCDQYGHLVEETKDHKPNEANEKQRIERAGGVVKFFNGAHRVHGLSTSRALGDFDIKGDNQIIATPDVYVWDMAKHKPKFMILASDGLWDVVSSEEAVTYIKFLYLTEKDFGAKFLATLAIIRGSRDNTTVVIVVFRNGKYAVGCSSLVSSGAK